MGIRSYLKRNTVSLNGEKSISNRINLEWWDKTPNVGDFLANVVYQWTLDYYNLDRLKMVNKTKHLMTIGSLIGMRNFDATIWGSGVHCMETVKKIYNSHKYVKYDIRAVRGPITRQVLCAAGYECPEVYGDPAILMPVIYPKRERSIKYECSVILHLSQKKRIENNTDLSLHYIDVETCDYKKFIEEIVSSRKIISSSLHGIILSESYGTPAIFLRSGMDKELIKFFDWYLSTNRNTIKMASSIEDALDMEPMVLPNLESLRMQLLNCFPKDLWDD